MRTNRIIRIVTILLLIAVAYLLFTLIQSYDRQRAELVKLQKQQQASRGTFRYDPAVYVSGNTFANSQHFDPDASVNGTLTGVLLTDPPSLNPLLAGEASASMVYGLCSLSLAERDWEHPEKFLPALAESWEISPDKKTYRLKLRSGVMWHDFIDPESGRAIPPREFTASDVKFTIDVIMDPEVNCAALRGYYADLEKVEIINDYEVVFHWKKPYYGSLSSTLGLTPLPRHFYCPAGAAFNAKKFNEDHLRNRMIVGCGPFRFVSWEKSKRIVLERNELYPGIKFKAAPALQKYVLEIIKIPNTQLQSLKAGKVSMLNLTPEQWQNQTPAKVFPADKFTKLRNPGTGYSYIGYNLQRRCFADAQTRRALTMLVNRQKILDEIMFGCGRIATGPFIPGSVYCDPALKPHPFDPAAARRLLAQAGWRDTDGDGILERDGEKFSFTMLQISGSVTQMKTLPVIQRDFAAAGIEMKLQVIEWSVLLERLKNRNFDACNLGWTGSFDPDLYQIFHSSQSEKDGSNFVSFKNDELDKKILELRQEFDPEKRIRLCHEMGRILHEEQPYTFMFYPDELMIISNDFGNVKLFPAGVCPQSFTRKEKK